MIAILVLNGPNLDKLGRRDPGIYGSTTLAEIESRLAARARDLGVEVSFVQSESETELIKAISEPGVSGIVINPAAFTHFSHRLVAALAAVAVPIVEVHLSNIHAREPYRRLSLISPVAAGVICGLGPEGYGYALDACARMISKP